MQSQRAVQYLSLLFALYFLTLETIFPIYYRERKKRITRRFSSIEMRIICQAYSVCAIIDIK